MPARLRMEKKPSCASSSDGRNHVLRTLRCTSAKLESLVTASLRDMLMFGRSICKTTGRLHLWGFIKLRHSDLLRVTANPALTYHIKAKTARCPQTRRSAHLGVVACFIGAWDIMAKSECRPSPSRLQGSAQKVTPDLVHALSSD